MRLPIILLSALLLPFVASAQSDPSLTPDTLTFAKAQVVRVASSSSALLPGTDTPVASQTLVVRILSGAEAGREVTFENDYTQLSAGETFYLRHIESEFDQSYYSVADPYRLPVLLAIAIAFLLLAALIGGWPGIRGVASFCGSLVLIFWLLIPGILAGYSPVLVAIGVASLIIVLGSYVTHGFTRTTSAAVLGMIVTVLITGLATYLATHAAHLSGYASEESIYLTFNSRGTLDIAGLLFGGIMIGLLGVLYDIAIGQAIAVEELFRAGEHMSRSRVFARGMRIGREHIGALVNTLAIAYVGAALPLLLLLAQSSDVGLLFTLNSELFATEIIRILMGSIGLILAVPFTTLIAVRMLEGRVSAASASHAAHAHVH